MQPSTPDPVSAALRAWRAAGPGRSIHLSSHAHDGARHWVATADTRNGSGLHAVMALAGSAEGAGAALTRLADHLERSA